MIFKLQHFALSIDYRTTAIEQIVQTFTNGQGFDVVYDTVGGATLDDAFKQYAITVTSLVATAEGSIT
jgi:NADPH:quinone reductase-like Zn-dependent oxidoreductase